MFNNSNYFIMKKFLWINVFGTVLVALIAVTGAYLKAQGWVDPLCARFGDGDIPLFSDPNNCQAYFDCTTGVPVRKCCPTSLLYCAEKQICAWPWDEDCRFNCDNSDKCVEGGGIGGYCESYDQYGRVICNVMCPPGYRPDCSGYNCRCVW